MNKPGKQTVITDPLPNLKSAGKKMAKQDESAAFCVHPDNFSKAPPTPEHIKKYRKSHNDQPGIIQRHYGVADDPQPPPTFCYGKKTKESDHVQETIKPNQLTGLADKINDIKEMKYSSHQREPLGATVNRNYELLDKYKQAGFKFGVPSNQVDSEAKDVLYPLDGEKEDDPAIKAQYVKTHADFGPGEQKERSYNWPFQKEAHAFGLGENKGDEGVPKCLHPERVEGSFPKTIIVQKTMEDFVDVSRDELGKAKNLGQGKPPVPNDFTYGIKNVASNQWNAAKCIYGEPNSAKYLEPDVDLGKCTKLNCTNKVKKPEDEKRVFGVPSIRTDIPTKKMPSISDAQNYGKDPSAAELLFPNAFEEYGITKEDFELLRPKEEIKDIFEKVGISYGTGKFEVIYARAQELCGGSDNVSVKAFMEMVKSMHSIE